MKNEAAFFDTVRKHFGPLSGLQVDGFHVLLAVEATAPLAFVSYVLATAWHETAATMQPVREAFNLSDAWRKIHLRYFPYYGRGYVQITWKAMYAKADAALAIAGLIKAGDLLKNLDLAMRPSLAAFIAMHGMTEGWFAPGHSLAHHFPNPGPATKAEFTEARHIINGVDRAELVAGYALTYQGALQDGGWGQ